MMGNSQEGTVWSVPAGTLASATSKLWGKLGSRGAEVIMRLNDNNDDIFRERVADCMLRECYEASMRQDIARLDMAHEVMGKNFWSLDDWAALFCVNSDMQEKSEWIEMSIGARRALHALDFPWGKDILNSTCPLCGNVVKDCHFAFLGLDSLLGKPLTILRLQEIHPTTGQPRFSSYAPGAWYANKKFAKETTMDFRWYLLHQNIVQNPEHKTFDDQKAMLTADYEVPSAVTEVTKNLLVFRKTGNFVNTSQYAGCKDVPSDGHRVHVGYCHTFRTGEISIRRSANDDNGSCIGIAASRLPGR